MHITTGSRALDALLGGGVTTEMLTDVYGASGSGKSQLCFTLCANCAREGNSVLFIDTTGTFRPERVSEIAGTKDVLDNITVIRTLNTQDQAAALEKVVSIDAALVVVDSLTSLFSAEYFGPSRHLAVMSHMHALALLAINAGCAVIATNMMRSVPRENGPSTEREYMSGTVSIHAHVRVKFEVQNAAKSFYTATLVQPPGGSAQFSISERGISDID